jgi:hypothetical protein
VPKTIFWQAVVAVCFWFLVYAAVLSGFLFYPPRRPSARHPAVGALGYATAIWLFCAGILFMGSYFFALLIVIMLALAFLFARQTNAKD